jgi:hypothetical protein
MKGKAIRKRQLFQTLTQYPKARLACQLKEAENLLAQASKTIKPPSNPTANPPTSY